MPKLLAFLPCSKVLTEPRDSSYSLISILDGVAVHGLEADKVPPDAVMRVQWAMFGLWLRIPDDSGKKYEQLIEIIMPSGKTIANSTLAFEMSARSHRTTVYMDLFPVSEAGDHTLRLSLREINMSNWEMVAEYPINVTFAPQDSAPE